MSDDNADVHSDNAEPSMEDILASIRQIIADDDDATAGLDESVGAEVVPTEAADVSDAIDEIFEDTTLEDTTPADIAVESDISSDEVLSALESDDSIDAILDMSSDDAVVDVVSDEADLVLEDLELDSLLDDAKEPQSLKTGFAAMAAAGLSATAAAGAATAQKLTETRSSPSVLTEAADETELSEALDLLLDDEELGEIVSNDADVELLESLLEIPDASDTAVEAFAEHENGDLEAVMPQSQTDEDLDLVKSLMADLTSSPISDESDMEALESLESLEPLEESDAESDLVDEILSLSMDDEVALQDMLEEDAPASESADSENDDVVDAMFANVDDATSEELSAINITEDLSPASTEPKAQLSALEEIAEAAKGDAERSEEGSSSAAIGLAVGAGLIATAGPLAAAVSAPEAPEQDFGDIMASIESGVEAEVEEAVSAADILDDIATELAPETLDDAAPEPINPAPIQADNTETNSTEETADMPKAAAKKDAIIDGATEKDTASAFASLNTVVEEKAANIDRGDRIGDMVQEALRPMLKEWLDKNLKGIVERAVTKEVKRISSGK